MSISKNKIVSLVDKFNSGDKKKIIKEFADLLKTEKRTSEILLIYADMLSNINDINGAINIFKEALKIKPDNHQILKKIYSSYIKIGKYEEAEIYLNKLLVFSKNNYEELRDKAFLLYLKKDFKNSIEYIEKAINIINNEVFGLNILGLLKLEAGKVNEALQYFKKAIIINANYADSYNNAGKCYIDLEDLKSAYTYFKKAYRLNSDSDLAILNIGNVLSLKDKNNLAIKFYEKAKEINNKNKLVDDNIAICQLRLKNLDWSQRYYEKIKKSKNINNDFLLGYAYLLLSQKNFKDGFNLFDARLKSNLFPKKNIYHNNLNKKLTFPKTFEKQKKILVVKEQGVGDEVLFSSIYADLLKDCTDIYIECDPRLIKIFQRSFEKDIFYPFGYFSSSEKKINNFDNIFYAGSLTKYYRKDIKTFNGDAFLKVSKDHNEKILNKLKKLNKAKKIGISWKSVINIYGKLKSLSINDFRSLFNPGRQIINLQYGDTEREVAEIKNYHLDIYSFEEVDLFNDFDSLMSILINLDVFVTVSNSTAHFAGALGVPTILICPKKSSTYYYWDYNNGKTPWYKSIKIVKIEESIQKTMDKVNKLIDSF